jgi:hypothetical protein
MNVFRSIARDLLNTLSAESMARRTPGVSGLNTVRQQKVAPVVDPTRYRDSFDQLPQGARARAAMQPERRTFHSALSVARNDSFLRDGFERAQRAPVDLSGGVKPQFDVEAQAPQRPVLPGNGFTASLDDLL